MFSEFQCLQFYGKKSSLCKKSLKSQISRWQNLNFIGGGNKAKMPAEHQSKSPLW